MFTFIIDIFILYFNDLKKPISSKPSNTRPTITKSSVVKTEDTQVETITNKNKITNPNFSEGEKINESIEHNMLNSNINNIICPIMKL